MQQIATSCTDFLILYCKDVKNKDISAMMYGRISNQTHVHNFPSVADILWHIPSSWPSNRANTVLIQISPKKLHVNAVPRDRCIGVDDALLESTFIERNLFSVSFVYFGVTASYIIRVHRIKNIVFSSGQNR